MKGTLFIGPDGIIQTIGEPCIPLDGEQHSERASEIVPEAEGKRTWFICLRLIFGEQGKVAAWTRQWKGPWRCTIYQTGERRTFETREHAVQWEVATLDELMSQ